MARGWPLTRWGALWAALTGHWKCELCNSTGHRSWQCGLLRHELYKGLIRGYLEARPELKKYQPSLIGPVPAGYAEHLDPVYRWANDVAYGDRDARERVRVAEEQLAKAKADLVSRAGT